MRLCVRASLPIDLCHPTRNYLGTLCKGLRMIVGRPPTAFSNKGHHLYYLIGSSYTSSTLSVNGGRRMTEGTSDVWGRGLCGRSLPPIKSLPAYHSTMNRVPEDDFLFSCYTERNVNQCIFNRATVRVRV